MKYKRLEFLDNDIYLLSTTRDYIIINNNYRGFFVLNYAFKVILSIDLNLDVIIDCVFCHENMLLMFCSERSLFVYIDAETGYYKQIPVNGEDWICSPIYDWREDKVTLFNYTGEKLIVDIKNSTICLTENNDEKIKELISKRIINFNCIEGTAIGSYEAVEVFDCKTGRVIYQIPVDRNYHDYEMYKSCFMAIGENNVILLCKQKKRKLLPNENYFFMRGKFFSDLKEEGIILLSGDKANANKCLLEKYCFDNTV